MNRQKTANPEPETPAEPALKTWRVGVVGIGQMGLAMALRLQDGGHAVAVHDVAADRCALAQEQGLTLCADAQAVAKLCDALIVAVVDAAQTQAVLFGPQGAAAALPPGAVVLLCPTIGPADTEGLAQRLQALHIDVIDAPMSGGPQRAREGLMSLMVAGDSAVLTRCQPLLQTLANPVFTISARPGDGARTKLVNNLLAAVNLAGACEALTLAQDMGLDLHTTLGVIEASSGQSWIGSDRLKRALAGDPQVRAATALLAKDSTLAMQAAAQTRHQAALGALAQRLFAQACADGHTRDDDASLLAWMQIRNLR